MKITKARLKEIIKEEVQKIIEGKRPPGMRKRTMKDLDDEAKTRETDFLKKKEKEEEEEELDETSMMSGLPVGDVAGHSGPAKKKAPLEEDGWDEPHVWPDELKWPGGSEVVKKQKARKKANQKKPE